jgi:hydroxymethylpyrimidine/phosphomethylpyrimidine kinase
VESFQGLKLDTGNLKPESCLKVSAECAKPEWINSWNLNIPTIERGLMTSHKANEKTLRSYRRVLTIAGSDSGGGAGIQADLKTFSALGCYGMSVITAVTAQNTRTVSGIHAVPPTFAAEQMDAVLADIGTDAVKIGMLFSAELIEIVAERLRKYRVANIVLDPVMVAKSGDKLLRDDAIEALKQYLIPLAAVITPNLPEAAVLLGRAAIQKDDMAPAAEALADFGCRSVMLKGGHLHGAQSTDCLYLASEKRTVFLDAPRLETVNTHGTGCTLSSAVAAYLARGHDIESAVRKAKDYIGAAIRSGAAYGLGHGHGPVHHFFKFWE